MSEDSLRLELTRLKIPQLKEHCRRFSLPVSGRKDLLVGRIIAHCVRYGRIDELYQEVLNGGSSGYSPINSGATSQRFYGNNGGVGFGGNDGGGFGNNYRYGGSSGVNNGYGIGSSNHHHHHHHHHHQHTASLLDALMQQPLDNGGGLETISPTFFDHNYDPLLEQGEEALRKIIAKDPYHKLQNTVYGLVTLNSYNCTTVIDMTSFPEVFRRDAPDYNHTKVLIYCTSLSQDAGARKVELENPTHRWPTAVQIHVNGRSAEVIQQANDTRYRNKALLERPCEIKKLVSQKPNNILRLEFPDRSCFQGKQWIASVVIAKEVKLGEFVQSMERKSYQDCMAIVKNVFGDGEVICDNMIVSLRDPVSMQRIKIPAKGRDCSHVQCFDAENFFKFQKSAKNAKWRCFICNKGPMRPEDVVVDEWFEKILQETNSAGTEIDEVEYFQDGTWKAKIEEGTKSSAGNGNGTTTKTEDTGTKRKLDNLAPPGSSSSSHQPPSKQPLVLPNPTTQNQPFAFSSASSSSSSTSTMPFHDSVFNNNNTNATSSSTSKQLDFISLVSDDENDDHEPTSAPDLFSL